MEGTFTREKEKKTTNNNRLVSPVDVKLQLGFLGLVGHGGTVLVQVLISRAPSTLLQVPLA